MAIKKKAAVKKKQKQGWFPKLTAGLTFSMVHNKDVPGIDDGLNLTIGVVLNGEVRWLYRGHQWKSTLKVIHTQSKTPSVEPFLKTADALDLKSVYQYRFKRYHRLLVFGGLQMVTALFPGNLVTAEDTSLTLLNSDGTVGADFTAANDKYRLTDPFSPVSFKQFAGVGILPSTDPTATLYLRLSMAAQQVWAGGYAVTDDELTAELELTELRNFQILGPQLEIELSGKLKKRLQYAFRAELLFPTWISMESTLRGFDLLNADISFKVGVKVSKWASLDYVFSAVRFPLIVDQWQVLNNLVLTVSAQFL